MNILLPAGWSAHGAHRPASTVAGILPRSGVHLMVTTASPATLAAVLGDIACSVASNIVDPAHFHVREPGNNHDA